MATPPDSWPLIIGPTRLEARAVRHVLPEATVLWSGVSFSRLPRGAASVSGAVVTCGVAGALRSGLPTGTVVVPARVMRPGGDVLECDQALVSALAAGARRLGHEPEMGMMATTLLLTVGAERAAWAARGCDTADMETGLLRGPRVASVRVVLDTPERELHPAWGRPLSLCWHPAAWRQLPWLAKHGPRCARLAAQVLAAGLAHSSYSK